MSKPRQTAPATTNRHQELYPSPPTALGKRDKTVIPRPRNRLKK